MAYLPNSVMTPQYPLFPLSFTIALVTSTLVRADVPAVVESARNVPVAYDVDVVVVGGSTRGVAAAVAAAKEGTKVFLGAPRPYLGEDICATLRLWNDSSKTPTTELARKILHDDKHAPAGSPNVLRPMHVKKTLDEALLRAEVAFLYGCYATDVLRDADGRPCGIVMANRAGRQAVVAKVIIDATDRAWVARMAGADSRPWPDGPQTFRRVVIGGTPRTDGLANRRVVFRHEIRRKGSSAAKSTTKSHEAVEYALKIDVPDGSFASHARVEQFARDATYQSGQLRGAESLFHVPPDPIVCRESLRQQVEPNEDLLRAFQPAGVPRIYVLGPCADIPRDQASRIMGLVVGAKIGETVGRAAAAEARSLPSPKDVSLPGEDVAATINGQIKETLIGTRPTQDLATIPLESLPVPVLGKYDVVVIGGGTSGAAAGIGAARRGARTLVVEYQEGLGGVGTLGLIGRYHRGLRIGFTAEVPAQGGEGKMEWWRAELRKAGADIWFGALGCGTLVDGTTVKGAVVATPEGRGVVLAKVVIDATGNADLAAAADAECMTTDEVDIAVQGAGMPDRRLGAVYTNTDYLLVDDADMVDVWRVLVSTKRKYAGSYDLGTLVQTRERRRVVGDYVLTIYDHMIRRTFPDTVVQSSSNYDSHGYPSGPYFALTPRGKDGRPTGGQVNTPYRCLLPKGLGGMLVIGLGTSAHRDAVALIRMQADLQNQGYAAGVAAAMAVQQDVPPRDVDVRKLQEHLVEKGNLASEVLEYKDVLPMPEDRIALAVECLKTGENMSMEAAIVLLHRDVAVPLLRDAHARAAGEERITYARFLGVCGESAALPTLIAAIEDTDQWDAKIPLGAMAEYSQLPTRLDSLILALGYIRDSEALPAILEKVEMLDADVCLSHHRAVSLALEQIADPNAARPLADLLQKPGMMGHAKTSLDKPSSRIEPLREIVLARALYRCGDHHGLGKEILAKYTRDIRGHFARHATAVLGENDE